MGKEKQFLQARNKSGYDETYCRHYEKSLGLYLKSVFCGFSQTGVFIMCVIMSLVSVFVIDPDEELIVKLVAYLLAGVSGFFYLCIIFKGLWYWKFTKHVFATSEGLWIAACSTFWWRGAPDFTGKRRLLAPSWSLYSWSELKGIATSPKDIDRGVSKIGNFFEDFDYFITKSPYHTKLFLKRWDGIELVDCLKTEYAEEILTLYQEYKRSRKKKIEVEDDA